MKKFLTFIFVLAMAQYSFAQITNSAHDFSLAASFNTNNGICIVCHTPHNGVTGLDAPLWNHVITSTLTFAIYDNTISSTMDATTGQPSGASKLCLSCHDGSVGLGDFGGVTGTPAMAAITANLGINLSNDHPVSFVYNDALASADGGLHDATSTPASLGGSTIEAGLLFGATTLASMECASCHDVHNSGGFASLLRMSNTNSQLCLTCHDK